MADSIVQKILFQMGTTGLGASAKKFGVLALKAGAVGLAFKKAAKELNELYDASIELDRLIKSLTTDMSEFNARTGGMIDTNVGLRAAIKLQNAELGATKEQMAALGVAAGVMNKRLGGGPEGTTTQFDLLINSVIKARETGLLPFGIELSQTTDKAAASREAMNKLVDKFAGMSVEADNAKERVFSFNNSLDTIKASEFTGFLNMLERNLYDVDGALADLTTTMGEYETDIVNTKGAISDWMWTQEGFLNRADRWASWFSANTSWIEESNRAYREQVEYLTEIADLQNEIQAQRKKQTDRSAINASYARFKAATGARDRGIMAREILSLLSRKPTSEMSSGEKKAFKEATAAARGGRGGGKKIDPFAANSSLDITGEDFFAGAGIKNTRPGTTGLVNELDTLNTGLSGALGRDVAGAGAGASQGAAAAAAQANATMLGQQRSVFNDMLGIERAYQDQSLQYAEQTNERKIELINGTADASVMALKNVATATKDTGEKGFKVSQALAYSANIVETFRGSMGAFNQVMATVPPPASAVLAPIAASSVAAVGAANGRKIRSQKFGGGGSSTPSTTSGQSFPTGGQLSGASDTSDTYNFAFVLNGSTIQRDSIRQNQLAKQSGDPHFVMDDA